MKKFLARHYQKLFLLSMIFAGLGLSMCIYGCTGAAQWISEAMQIIPIASSMAASLITLIGALTGKTIDANTLTVLSQVTQDIESGLSDISSMVQEYQQTPSTTLLQNIKTATQSVIDGLSKFLSDTSIITDAATQQKIVAIFQLILTEVTSFQSLLPVLTAAAGDRFTIVVPMTTKAAKAAFDKILSTPSGNPAVDEALTHLKRL